MFDIKKILFHLSCLFWSCLRQEDKCVLCSSMSTKMEVPLQSEFTECLVDSRHCAWVQTWPGYVLGPWGALVCGRNMTITTSICYGVCSVQSLSHVQLFATPWTAAHQASLSFTNSWSLLKLMFIESVMPSSLLILYHPLLLLPSIFPTNTVFSNE